MDKRKLLGIDKGKAVGIVGVFGMATIAWTAPAFVIAGVASLCILALEDKKEVKPSEAAQESTLGKED